METFETVKIILTARSTACRRQPSYLYLSLTAIMQSVVCWLCTAFCFCDLKKVEARCINCVIYRLTIVCGSLLPTRQIDYTFLSLSQMFIAASCCVQKAAGILPRLAICWKTDSTTRSSRCRIITDRINTTGNAIASVRPFARPYVCLFVYLHSVFATD